MYIVAERIIGRMPENVAQVCGSIATGGLGSIEANLAAFDAQIKTLQESGVHVYSILDDFCLPLMNQFNIIRFINAPR